MSSQAKSTAAGDWIQLQVSPKKGIWVTFNASSLLHYTFLWLDIRVIFLIGIFFFCKVCRLLRLNQHKTSKSVKFCTPSIIHFPSVFVGNWCVGNSCSEGERESNCRKDKQKNCVFIHCAKTMKLICLKKVCCLPVYQLVLSNYLSILVVWRATK